MVSMFKRFRSLLVAQFNRLMRSHDTPHALAGGVAIGLVIGFTPLAPIKTLLAILGAWVFRCSKLAAVLAVTGHDLLLPIWPIVLRWEFQIGYYLLSHPHHLPPKLPLKHLHWQNYLHFKELWIVWPTLLGSLVISIPISAVCYFIVLWFARHHPLRKKHAQENAASTPAL